MFASSLGTQHLRGVMPLSDRIKGYPEYLRRAGYYCTNNVKEDYNFETPPTFWDESSDTAHWRKGPKRKPFFSIFNLMTTHQSRTRYEQDELDKVNKDLPAAARRDPAKAPLPPYYPDSPRIRTNVAVFYTQVA
ncbi:MAG: sulfatase, partial [Planctomycetota bacterium]